MPLHRYRTAYRGHERIRRPTIPESDEKHRSNDTLGKRLVGTPSLFEDSPCDTCGGRADNN
jgi:hypothetical protein